MQKKNKRIEVVIISLLIVFAICILISTYLSKKHSSEYSKITYDNIIESLKVNGDYVSTFLNSDGLSLFTDSESKDYKNFQEKLSNYVQKQDLISIYFISISGNAPRYVVGSDSNFPAESTIPKMVEKASNGQDNYSEFDSSNNFIVSYHPVYDVDDNIIAVIRMDKSSDPIRVTENYSVFFTYAFLVEIITMVIASLLILSMYRKHIDNSVYESSLKNQFLYRINHEVRTPMTAILGFCRIARTETNIETIYDHIDQINSSSQLLLQSINNIIDISRIESGDLTLSPEPFSIHQLLQNIERVMKIQANAKQQTFSISFEDDLPKLVVSDKRYITQILVNLISNAIKFTPEKGSISTSVSLLEVKNQKCNLQFIIKDSGVGIEDKYISILLEDFEKNDGSISKKSGNIGLGLTMTKLLIERMNGSISIDSKIGEGSTFKFNLWVDYIEENHVPVKIVQEKTTVNVAEAELLNCNGMHFLVVEDNDINQLIIENILKGLGATIEFATNGRVGLDKYLQNPNSFNIIFMDIQMPVMDGLEATRKIRESNCSNSKTIPIIAMTAEVFKEDIDRALEAGVNIHVGKPFKVEDISLAINKAIKE